MTGRWDDDARCRRFDAELFFPEGGGEAPKEAEEQAKAVCGWCPIQAACLERALALEGASHSVMRAGIWGGYNPAQRARIARERGIKRKANPYKAAVVKLHRAGLDRAAIGRHLGIDHRTVRGILRSQKLAA